jgi:hypothetical protein
MLQRTNVASTPPDPLPVSIPAELVLQDIPPTPIPCFLVGARTGHRDSAVAGDVDVVLLLKRFDLWGDKCKGVRKGAAVGE